MKRKRLVSAILAVGMALTMLPTAAFATDTPHITNVKFNGDEVDTEGTKETPNANPKLTDYPTYVAENDHWQWQHHGVNYMLTFFSGILDPENAEDHIGTGDGVIPCEVYAGGGSIESGTFKRRVVLGGCKVNGGTFYQIQNRNGGVDRPVTNAFINRYESTGSNAILEKSIVYGNVKMTSGKLKSGIVCNIPDDSSASVTVNSYRTLTAEGGIITPVVAKIPSDAKFMGKAYIVGDDNLTETFTIKPASPTFAKWEYDKTAIEQNGGSISEDGNVLTVTMPTTGDVTIKAVMEPVDLEVGIVDGKKVPVYKGEFYAGSDVDGWHYDEETNALTVYENGVVDLGVNEVDWTVDNYGTIEGGVFNYKDNLIDVFTNEEGATIKGGIFNVTVNNNYGGTIENGVFKNKVNNYGVVNGGTFMGYYSNIAKTETQPDKSVKVLTNGYTYGGVFNHSANFSYDGIPNAQEGVKVSWVTLNNCTANGISGMVGVVGNQTLNVEADATSWTGWEVTADPSYEEAITKQVGNTTAFDLTLNGDDEWSVTLTAQVKEGYYRMSLTDGTATNADGTEITSAKAGNTVKLTAADAPEGMVFDRWEISPANVALTLEEGGFDSHAATASFKMPAQTLSIRAMYRMADQPEEPNVLGTVAMVATAGVGAAVVGYTGYMIGTELYLNTVLPDGVAIPQNTAELAKLVWTEAGKPAPAAVMAPDVTDEQKALTWAIENQLISADKAADASVSRWEVIQTWNKAQEMKG